MSTVFNLEIAEGVDLEEIAKALNAIPQVEVRSKEDFSLNAYFPASNVNVWVDTDLDDKDVVTEGLYGVGWKVGARVCFYVDPTLSDPLRDIKSFVLALSRQNELPFALSFQYEVLFVKRDGDGLVFLEDM